MVSHFSAEFRVLEVTSDVVARKSKFEGQQVRIDQKLNKLLALLTKNITRINK